jgi:hypothetical protein
MRCIPGQPAFMTVSTTGRGENRPSAAPIRFSAPGTTTRLPRSSSRGPVALD